MTPPSSGGRLPLGALRGVFFGWWMVAGASFLNAVGGGIYFFGFSAFFLPLTEEFDADYGTISTVFGLSNLVQGGLLAPFLGTLIDRLGTRRIMVAGITLLGLAYVLISTAPNLALFYVFFVLMAAPGILMGTQWPASTAIANWFSRRRGRAFGIVNAGFGLGATVVIATNFLIASLGWRDAALIIGIFVLAVGYPLSALMRHRPEQHGMAPDGAAAPLGPISNEQAEQPAPPSDGDFSPKEALNSRAFWLLFLSFSLRSGVSGATWLHLIPLIVDKGFEAGEGALLLAVFGVTSIPFRIVAATLLDYFDKRYVAAFLSGVMALSTVALVRAESLWEVVLAVVLFAVGSGGTAGLLQPIGAAYFGRRHYATIMGYGSMVGVASLAGFPVLAGFLRDATGAYTVTLYALTGGAVLAAISMLLARQPDRTRSAVR